MEFLKKQCEGTPTFVYTGEKTFERWLLKIAGSRPARRKKGAEPAKRIGGVIPTMLQEERRQRTTSDGLDDHPVRPEDEMARKKDVVDVVAAFARVKDPIDRCLLLLDNGAFDRPPRRDSVIACAKSAGVKGDALWD